MKTAKELLEKMQNDETFAREFQEAVMTKKDEGVADVAEAIVAVAKGFDYEVAPEQARRIVEKQSEQISEEELGAVAGGCFRPSGCHAGDRHCGD